MVRRDVPRRTCSWPETVRYAGAPKNKSLELSPLLLCRGATAWKASPPPSQSLLVRMGVSTRVKPEFCDDDQRSKKDEDSSV